jgi:hypothetical protein
MALNISFQFPLPSAKFGLKHGIFRNPKIFNAKAQRCEGAKKMKSNTGAKRGNDGESGTGMNGNGIKKIFGSVSSGSKIH